MLLKGFLQFTEFALTAHAARGQSDLPEYSSNRITILSFSIPRLLVIPIVWVSLRRRDSFVKESSLFQNLYRYI
ncbi:MAG: hypothetical protein WBF90_33660 [Rivularia sp. (in: cyanobacteria)]